jgi:hypothetical protein
MRKVLLLLLAVLLMGATSPPVTVPITITASSGTTINATDYCAANGGGDGSSGTPWQDQCIVAAINAAPSGSTVILAAGNWALNTSVATFTGSITGSTLTVSGVTGTIAIGQAVNGSGVIGSSTGTNFYLPVYIIGGSGSTWTLSNSLSTGVSGAMTSGYPVVIQNAVNLVGAGSGNTFDVYGHPKNGYSASYSAVYSAITPSGSIARVYTTGPIYTNSVGAGGFITINNHASGNSGQRISNIFADGSHGFNGGGITGTIILSYCTGCVVDNIRLWAADQSITTSGETQFAINLSNSVTVKNSIFAEPPHVTTGPFYSQGESDQTQWNNGHVYINDLYYQTTSNPIDSDSLTYDRIALYCSNITDGIGICQYNATLVETGCQIGTNCPPNGGTTGNYHFAIKNSYLYSGSAPVAIGGGINDPGGSGEINDVSLVGNWLFGGKGAIAGCGYSLISASGGGNLCASGQGNGSGSGMQINCAGSPCNLPFAITGNSLIASGGGSTDILNATGTGIGYAFGVYGANFTGRIDNGTVGNAGNTLTVSAVASGTLQTGQFTGAAGVSPNTQITASCGTNCWTINGSPQSVASGTMVSGYNNTVYGFNATKNYLSSGNNQYLTDGNGISPVQSNNYCAGSSFSGCNTSGFTTPPACSFTLGTLSGSIVPFASTTYATQYGAAQWIASTSSATPASADSRWNNDNDHGIGDVSGGNSYMPPVSLTPVLHGDTVYAWVMDNNNQISSCGSVGVP